jgi:hypothetical protein
LRGAETAVLETVQEWRSLHARARPTLNVVSELRKVKPHQGVVSWIQAAPEESLYISAVTVGEIQAGIEINRRQDAAKAKEIEGWLDGGRAELWCNSGGRRDLSPLGATYAPAVGSPS